MYVYVYIYPLPVSKQERETKHGWGRVRGGQMARGIQRKYRGGGMKEGSKDGG